MKKYSIIFLLFLLCGSCSPTKMVPTGEEWFSETNIVIEDELAPEVAINLPLLIKQKPNKKSLSWRSFRLDWYNFLGGDKHPIDGSWVRRNWNKVRNWSASTIGNRPVIYQSKYKNQARKDMATYLESKGYYFAQVTDTVIVDSVFLFNDPKIKVIYRVKAGLPYEIQRIKYQFEDTFIQNIVLEDTTARLFQVGHKLDASLLQNERLRITDTLKRRGYYRFAKEYLHYEISKNTSTKTIETDSLSNNYLVDITVKLQPYVEHSHGKDVVFIYHPVYRIRDIYVLPNYDPQQAIRNPTTYFNQSDTSSQDGIYFLHNNQSSIRYPTLLRGFQFKKKELYNSALFDNTTRYLNTLSAVKLSNVHFSEVDQRFKLDTILDQRVRWLDCHLNITNSTKQYYSIDLEGNYASQEYFGLDASINYRHKNLFRGSEDFNIAFSTSAANNELGEAVINNSSGLFNSIKYGVDASIALPKFLVPFGFSKFRRKYTPQTLLNVGLAYERRPDFNNQNAQFAYGYKWATSREQVHFFNLIDLFATRIIDISSVYRQELEGRNLLADYSDKIIPALNYTYIYNGIPRYTRGDLAYFRFKIESAGNITTLMSEVFNRPKTGNPFFKDGDFKMYNLFSFPVSQYVKGEIDWRYHWGLIGGNKVALRMFAGVGIPYGNFPVMPSHKQFMSGGMNSLRGWSPGRVGPGNFPFAKMETYLSVLSALPDVENLTFISRQQRGEMKLEMNIEYRQKIADMYELALFFDIGNTWALSENNVSNQLATYVNENIDVLKLQEPIQTLFDWSNFSKQFAYNTGFGVRLDMSFFVLRVDFGAKINDPGAPEDGIFRSGLFKIDNWRLNFGIGHPF